ncbi:helix-turn-helix domain-containing protein [Kitasatospora sp. NPDC088346]|uniref:helix-turn-helix domain-containing protein n=1 Tax=Kitasatospora sp. NPDC088346 TaxID=3364073 RepID=UPI00382B30D9
MTHLAPTPAPQPVLTRHPDPLGPPGLGTLIRNHRHRAGMTQRQLADLSTLSVRAIRDLEAGKVRRPRRETVRLLTDALRLAEPQRRAVEEAVLRLHLRDDPAGAGAEDDRIGPVPLALATPDGAVIGREDELTWLTRAVGHQRQRFVSVVGLSGIGSSRLALEAAGLLREELGWPVLWLDARHLAGGDRGGIGWEVPSPPPLLRQVVEMLTGPPERAAEARAGLLPVLGVGNRVLVLDGLGAADLRGDRLTELLQRCPGLRVITTGLAPLHLQGEQVLPLSPLAVPPPFAVPAPPSAGSGRDAAEAFSAVRLFATHMLRVRPGFALHGPQLDAVVDLCRLLDGIPRAITYAAEWCLMHSPRQLVDQVRADPLGLSAPSSVSGPSLHLSLQRSIDALDPEPALLLRCLAGLVGPWTLGDAHALVGGTWAGLNRTVHRLVVRGLVRHCGYDEEDRFVVPALLRLALACRAPEGG